MAAFLGARQTGQASARGSHALHRHRCRHGSSSTDASPPPHALHGHLLAAGDDASASAPAASASTKQWDSASSAAAPARPAPESPKPSTAGCAGATPAPAPRRRRVSSAARSPVAAASLLRARPHHAWLSAAACRSRSSSSALLAELL